MFVDSHCHLKFPELREQIEPIRAAMAQAKVERALCICTTMEEFESVHALALRYDVFCAPCHDRTGSGHGLVPRRGWIPPPNFHTDALRAYTPGQFFSVITHGIRTMPSYAKQIPEGDRWAIASYVQALQRSHYAKLEDVPPAQRAALR